MASSNDLLQLVDVLAVAVADWMGSNDDGGGRSSRREIEKTGTCLQEDSADGEGADTTGT